MSKSPVLDRKNAAIATSPTLNDEPLIKTVSAVQTLAIQRNISFSEALQMISSAAKVMFYAEQERKNPKRLKPKEPQLPII